MLHRYGGMLVLWLLIIWGLRCIGLGYCGLFSEFHGYLSLSFFLSYTAGWMILHFCGDGL